MTMLFGDDLAKTMKDVSQTNRIGAKLVPGKGKFPPVGKPFLRKKPANHNNPHQQYQSGWGQGITARAEKVPGGKKSGTSLTSLQMSGKAISKHC